MKCLPLVIILLISLCLISPVFAEDIGRYSYITVERVDISVRNEQATINIQYRIDEGIRLLVLLLGRSDLKKKLTRILNYQNGEFQIVELDHSIVVLRKASFDYGDGSYWFPEHEFGMTIPQLTVSTPQVTRTYNMTNEFPNGVGHFRVI